MAEAQANLYRAIVNKLRVDTGVGSLVVLTGHSSSSASQYRIARDKKPTKSETPFLGVSIYQSVPLSDDGPSHIQRARVYFYCYSTEELVAIQLADRVEHLLHARDEQADLPLGEGTNLGHYNFSDDRIRNQQTRYKSRDLPDFDDDTDVWQVLVEADLIWNDSPC